MKLNALIVGMKWINPVCDEIKFDNSTLTILLLMMAVVPVAAHLCLQLGKQVKQVRHFRLSIFTSREERGKNKQKMPKSPWSRSSSERKALPETKNPIYIGWGEEMYQYDKTVQSG